jgi:hypothetical protein
MVSAVLQEIISDGKLTAYNRQYSNRLLQLLTDLVHSSIEPFQMVFGFTLAATIFHIEISFHHQILSCDDLFFHIYTDQYCFIK